MERRRCRGVVAGLASSGDRGLLAAGELLLLHTPGGGCGVWSSAALELSCWTAPSATPLRLEQLLFVAGCCAWREWRKRCVRLGSVGSADIGRVEGVWLDSTRWTPLNLKLLLRRNLVSFSWSVYTASAVTRRVQRVRKNSNRSSSVLVSALRLSGPRSP